MRIKNGFSWVKHIDFMLVDIFALVFSFAVSYRMKFGDFGFIHIGTWVGLLITVVFLNVIISFFVDPYSGIFRRSYYQEIIRAFQLSFYNFLAASVIFYAFKIGINYSRVMLFLTYGMYFVLSLIFKYLWKKLLVTRTVITNVTKPIPIFVIGKSASIETTIHDVCAGDFSIYSVEGVHLIDEKDLNEVIGKPVVNDDVVKYILDENIQEVLVAVPPSEVDNTIYSKLLSNGIGINFIINEAIGFQPEEQAVGSMGVYQTLSTGTFSFSPKQGLYLIIKRAVDIIVSLIGMVFFIPLSLIIKVAFILGGDYSSIFYKQARVGLNGKQIEIYKFRSMVPNAEEILKEMLKDEKYREEWEANQKFENDPRITPIGRFLRKTSLDEIPQLINVLKGEMSLVGPRPLVQGELETHGGLKLYQKVKPGITGWWGCNGRSNIDYKERLELEYYYVRNCSLYLDVLCILRTIFVVLKKEGAK